MGTVQCCDNDIAPPDLRVERRPIKRQNFKTSDDNDINNGIIFDESIEDKITQQMEGFVDSDLENNCERTDERTEENEQGKNNENLEDDSNITKAVVLGYWKNTRGSAQ